MFLSRSRKFVEAIQGRIVQGVDEAQFLTTMAFTKAAIRDR